MVELVWSPERIWDGETCFILGGGPSLTQRDVDRLFRRRVITINSSAAKARNAGVDDGVLYFNDTSWFLQFRHLVHAWRGFAVTTSPAAAVAMPDKVRRVTVTPWHRPFPAPGSACIRGGRSSGHKAISLAIALGCRRVVLLGYDMRAIDGRSHHHDDYACRDPVLYAADFIPAFAGWRADAEALGVEIVNATPHSALKEFPAVALDDMLTEPIHAR